MTNLNTANIGMNKYCGPAVLSILTGRSTDDCARVISSVNGSYKVEGVEVRHLLLAASRLGFDSKELPPGGSLFGTLTRLSAAGDGMYIISLPNHFVVIEMNQKKAYFCDNHTKEPIPAASSARLLQKVSRVHQVFKRRETEIVRPAPKVQEPELEVINQGLVVEIKILNRIEYNNPMYNYNQQVSLATLESREAIDAFLKDLKLKGDN